MYAELLGVPPYGPVRPVHFVRRQPLGPPGLRQGDEPPIISVHRGVRIHPRRLLDTRRPRRRSPFRRHLLDTTHEGVVVPSKDPNGLNPRDAAILPLGSEVTVVQEVAPALPSRFEPTAA
jgi:hypothetical protein